MENEIFKVSKESEAKSIAGAIVERLKISKKVELQAIGAGAVNQAVKAVAIARGFVAPRGAELVCIPAFTEVDVEEDKKTGIKLIVKEEN